MKKSIISLCMFFFSLVLVANAEAISFVQVSAATPQTPQSTVSVTYSSAQTSGNLNVVVVGWNDSAASVTSVTDTKGNTYQLAVGPTIQSGVASQSIYYAKNIAGPTAGGNTVTVNFGVAARYPDLRILEYSGLDRVNPVDVVKAATGTNTTSNSGSVTTINANDLLFAANLVQTSTRAAGTGFTSRIISSPDGDIAEDRIVSAVGSYSATASLTSAGAWIMQMVAFKAATNAPDLTIAKTHSGNFTQGQTGATYTITATNIGAAPTTGTVTVTDTLPAGLTATALSGTGWTCTLATLTCTRSDVLAASGSYPALSLTVNVAANAPASVTNTATVSGGGDTNAANNTANDPTTITQAGTPDLSITKTHSGNFTQGQTGATYTITATNVGTAPTTGTVTVTDTLPSGLTAIALSGTGWTCTLATLTCTRSDVLAASGSYPAISLTVNVASNAPPSVTNIATVSGGGDANSANNTASNATTISPAGSPDLAITKTHSGNFTQGQVGATYTLTVSDVGAASTSGTVTVIDTLPTGLTATALSGTGWACTLGTLTCTRSDALAASGSYPAISLTVNVASNAPPSVTNIATVSGGGDTNSANNTASNATTIGSAITGLVAAYSFNEGLGTTVADASGNGNTGTITNATWTTSGKFGNALVFNGTNALVTINDSASLHLTTAMTLEAWVNPSTVSSTWRDVIYKGNDNYFLEGTSSAGSVPAGGGTFGGAGSEVYGTAALPVNTWTHLAVTYDGATLRLYVNGVQVSSQAQTGNILTSPNPLQIGGDSLFGQYFTGMIDEVRVYNVALTAAQIQVDMNTSIGGGGNPQPDLSITKTHSGNFTPGQSGATYTITVTNVGSAPTTGTVTMTDTLPSGLTGTALSGTGWTCTLATLTCTRSDVLAALAGYPAITLTVNVAANAPSSVTNTATVSGGGDTNAANNTANDLTVIANSVLGLVAAYSFNEGLGTTTADVSGNGNTGTITNATWTTSGKFGNALVFNGTNALVTINDSASLHLTTAMTLEAWVNPSTVSSTWRDAIYKGNDNYYLEATSSAGGAPAGGGTFAPVEVYGTSSLAINTWTHLAVTYDGVTLRLYVNGVQVSSVAQTGAIQASTNPLQIGGDSIYGQYFTGIIDEVRVYNVALTATQIQADMNTPIANPIPDTQPPTAPSNLTASAVSATQINLNWTASTDNVGVTGYGVERCQGTGCTNFAQIGTAAGTVYSDGGLTGNTTYLYRVRATDAAGNLSTYSNVAQATTGFLISPRITVLTFTRTQQFTASGSSVTWSVDGVTGGSASSGTITTTGLYTPPNAIGTHTVTASAQSQSANATVLVTNYPGTFTHHNDNFRTGQNLNETVLTPSNVNSGQFGKLFSYPLDGKAYSSPLYVANVNIPGQGFHNVVYAATEHDSVYAFDADGLSSNPLWHVSFINPAAGITTVPPADTGETGDITPEIGITGTPVIDPGSGTLYVVAKTKEVIGSTTNYVQRLHALDITTGAEKFGGPVVLQANLPGTGNGSQGGQIPFLPLRENQRPALLLSNGTIYIGFGSHGDNQPFHGWVLGYNATNLQQTMAYIVTANGEDGGIWQSGGGLAADSTGNIFFMTGNGTFDADTGGVDYGDSFVRMSPGGVVLDYFAPHDQSNLDLNNLDLGSSGPMLLPDQSGNHPHLLLGAGKDATIYLIDRDNMGHYNPSNDNQIVQSLVNIFPNGTPEPGNFCPPIYFNRYVYFSPVSDVIKAFQLSNGLLSTAPTSQSSEVYLYPGGALAISANGNANGILWAVQRFGVDPAGGGTIAPGVLRAYDSTNLAFEFYNSNQAGTRDTLDYAAKFNIPLVANGKVFVAGENQLTVYGLLP